MLLLSAPVLVFSQNRAVDSEGNPLSVEMCVEQSGIKESQGNYREASWFLNQAALTRWEEKRYDEAINYFKKSVKLNEKVNNEHGIIGIYSNLAMIYADQEKHEESLDYFFKTLEGRKKENANKVGIISAHINTAVALNNLQRHNEAAEHLEEALTMAREMSDAQQMRSCYGMLSETYEKAGKTEESIRYFNLYRTFHEKVQRDKEAVYKEREREAQLQAKIAEAEKKAKAIELSYKEKELEEKQQEMSEIKETLKDFDDTKKKLYASMSRAEMLQTIADVEKHNKIEQQEKYELQMKQQRYILYSLVIGAIGIMAFAAMIYRSYRIKKKANNELSERNQEIMAQREQIFSQKESLEVAFQDIFDKNKRITQSINYAQRIQTAMIPSDEEMAMALPNSFVLFQPRDIVSGDFYWCKQKGNQVIVAAADCTGHGVPGALVSMVGMNLLDQIVNQSETLNPGKVLENLHLGIHASLGQGSKQTADGMDIALLVLEPENNRLLFAGAKNPLVYIKDGKVERIKGDSTPIGGRMRKGESLRTFQTHEIPIDKGMRFYIFSDGYQDQFGGQEGRKLMSTTFRNLLLKTSNLPLENQKEALGKHFHQWKGEREQIDDVLVLGMEMK